MIAFILNNEYVSTSLPPGTLLLDYIRYHRQLPGTKIGCREGDCGACTVLIGELINQELQYNAVTSCLTPLGNVQHKHVVTVEGINIANEVNTVQQALSEEGGTQCGFCTPGFIVSMTGFCLNSEKHTYQDAVDAVGGNICRCTGYKSIERALMRIVAVMQQKEQEAVLDFAIARQMVPAYFLTVKEKLEQLAGQAGTFSPQAHPTAPFLGGGTDLYVQQPEELVHSELHFLFNNAALKGIVREGNQCVIGAAATITDLMASPVFKEVVPEFPQYASLIASVPIRNIATLAGNFVNASPIGDLSVLFLALEATIQLREGAAARQVPLRDFFKGYKQLDKKPGEFIEQIRVDMPVRKTYIHFEKVSKRRNLDIATVNTAIKLIVGDGVIDHCSLAAGGVAPVPAYLAQTSAFLQGKKITEALVEEAALVAQQEITPISDARGTAAYKKQLLGQLVKAHFITLFPWLNTAYLLQNGNGVE